ncbi:MAG TPA: ELM1/GtrOC1 family putative glycosyltransferase [Wenzhouxiangellaceae bacterium]|nr:ELM1/GtrOC1 family putative glycosyltransferase [Wenzhouxiangellaceae bacterium]
MSESAPPNTYSSWVLCAPGAGDQRQLKTLAGALGGEVRPIKEIDSVGAVLRDRLSGAARRPFGGAKALRYVSPWPDLILIAGGRSVIDARRIRAASGGRSKIVAIGRPWAAYGPLNLIVTTPQYRLPPADNVIEIPLPLNAPPEVSDSARQRLKDALPRSGAPTVGVLLGGDSGSFRFGSRAIEEIAARLTGFVQSTGARLVACSSPRTPHGALDALESTLGGRATLFPPAANAANPYPAVLADCDALAVTGDSASMLAEACLSGKPVAVLPLNPRRRSRAARAVGGLLPGSARTALTRYGLWLPSRDLPRLHAVAESHGWVRPLDRLLDGPVENPPTLESLLAPVRSRIENLLHD